MSAAPVVATRSPANHAVGVPLGANITLEFAAALDPSTIVPANVIVTSSLQGLRAAALTWSAGALTLTIDPVENSLPGERIEVSLTKGVRDAEGQSLPNGWRTEFSSWTATVPGATFTTTGTTWGTGSIAFNVTVGDLTGDGFAELIFSNVVPDSLTILSSDGAGGFSPLAIIGRPDATLPRHVALGDLDENGHLDMVMCASGPNKVEVIRNLGGGAFAAPVVYATGTTPYGAYLGDLDADGDLDVVTANFNSQNISVLRNNGTGTLGAPTHTSAGVGADSPRWVDGADFDDDGDIDLAVCNGYSYDVSIFKNNGSGVFAVPTALLPVDESPQFLATRDFTGDGIADVVTVNSVGESVSLLAGNGDGTFAPALHTSVAGQFPYGIQVVDLDGDDDLDLVLPIRGASAWQPVWNDGNGVFTAGSLNPGGVYCHTVGASDWDGDGDIDVAAGFWVSRTMQYYEQVPVPALTQVVPLRNATGLAVDASIDLSFNVDLSPVSLVPTSFVMHGSQSGTHDASLSWSAPNHRVTLTPADVFLPGEVVTVTAKGGGAITSIDGVVYDGDVLEFMTSGAPAAGTFAGPVSIGLPGIDPVAAASADLDRDGRVDLIIANLLSADVTTLLSTGGTPAVTQTISTGESPVALTCGDLDSDGDADVAVACFGSARIDILNNAAAALSVASSVPVPGLPFALSNGDVDQDGDQDLVVACIAPDALRLLRNDGGGVFTAQAPEPLSGSPTDVELADFDSDGDLDLAATIGANQVVEVYRGYGDGGFGNSSAFAAPQSPVGLLAGDMDGDAAVDLVVAGYMAGELSVLSNLGSGTFLAGAPLLTSAQPRSLWGADLTGDGRMDLATIGSADGEVAVISSQSAGGWNVPWTKSVGETPYAITGGDFNGDGRLDLAAVDRASGDLSLLWGESATGVVAPGPNSEILLRAWPNPFSETVSVHLYLPATATHSTVSIYDIAGRVVTRLLEATDRAGDRTLTWDGRDARGKRASAGIYFLRLESRGGTATQKLIRIG